MPPVKLLRQSLEWKYKMRKKKGACSSYSPWWPFVHDFNERLPGYLETFMAGEHKFSPLRGSSKVWCPLG